ncbi:hypothetical protein KC19_12G023800 [Ceratodon purpureus]|uniref:Fumarylacetoacetase-like C-terminal domain-containing protein n=1 Tax=Ceratodon purpureus TaxID=3225 RepID=A0A8T0G548_CERPU|nr:hypothetical protein KC19_12G023800 [Ceratodon purpureus]
MASIMTAARPCFASAMKASHHFRSSIGHRGLSAPRSVFNMSQRRKQSSAPVASLSGKPDHGFKLATFQSIKGEDEVGIIRGNSIWFLKDALKTPMKNLADDMTAVIRNWDLIKDSIHVTGEGIDLSDVKLQAPIPRPAGTIMCIGKNYLDHVKEVDTWKTAPGITQPEAPKHPIVFTKASQSVVGPGAAIKYPHGWSDHVDYEAELAVIIGKPGRGISKEDAFDHIFGYTILNDVTAREVQKRHQQWFLGKSCDTFCPMGPWIVPASQLDGQNLSLQCWINDELRQDGRTSDMIFSIAELIETISVGITLQPGDILATGTPSGVGSGFNPPRHLKPGDKVRIKIEGIGELHNHVV